MNRSVLHHLSSLAALAAGVLLGGCASTQMGAHYLDPQTPKQALRGAAVLVVCEAPEPAIRLICESEATAQLTQLGAMPLTDPKLAGLMSGREPAPDQYLPAAKAAGAQALFRVTLAPDFWRPSPMSGFSFGIGAWGGSGGFSGGSAGVGVSMPVGGSGSASGFAGNGSLLDVASGRVLWSASATASPRGDASAQVGEVVRALTGAVRDTGLF
ncbi:MAG: hypothetical protein WAK92_11065 [Thiobacillus sp.]